MRILLLTQWFDPEPTLKGLIFAKELQAQGHEVEILTGFPNYPGGTVYEGYRVRLFQREVLEGVPVVRVALYPSHDTSPLRRVANYVSFALSAAILGPLLVKKADVVYVQQGPATIALAGAALKYLRGMPLVYDIIDLWPDTLPATGMVKNQIILKLVDIWCNLAYRIADHVVVVAPGLKKQIVARGVPAQKVSVIYNWSDERQLQDAPAEDVHALDSRLNNRFKVVFAGNMGILQALDSVLDGARLLKDRCPNVIFVFIGGGIEVERLRQRCLTESLDNVLFLPRRPPERMRPILEMADALLVHLSDVPLFRITIPSKTQAYLAIGRPVLMCVHGDGGQLIEDTESGLACPPEDPAALADAVEKLQGLDPSQLAAMGSRGRAYYQQSLSLRAGSRAYAEVFRGVARAGLS